MERARVIVQKKKFLSSIEKKYPSLEKKNYETWYNKTIITYLKHREPMDSNSRSSNKYSLKKNIGLVFLMR